MDRVLAQHGLLSARVWSHHTGVSMPRPWNRSRPLHRSLAALLAVGVAAGLFACSAERLVAVHLDAQSQTIVIAVGQPFDISLGNLGPGIFQDPPTLSSDAVTYLSVEVVPPPTPGGPTQRFHFRAAHAGLSVVTLRRVLGDSLLAIVVDTVQVR